MKPKHRRLLWALAGLACVGTGTAFALNAFRDSMVYFRSPSELASLHPDEGTTLRMGGLVVDGSLERTPDGELRFTVTDYKSTTPVTYRGEVPALFREGQGVVAEGKLRAGGVFHATKLLAKHDENYMPPEVKRSLEKAGHPTGAE